MVVCLDLASISNLNPSVAVYFITFSILVLCFHFVYKMLTFLAKHKQEYNEDDELKKRKKGKKKKSNSNKKDWHYRKEISGLSLAT